MFGNILKERRLELELTQQEVAEYLHVSRQTVSNWECGKNFPDIPVLVSISDYYDISLDQLLKHDEHYLAHIRQESVEYKKLRKRSGQKLLGRILLVLFACLLGFEIKASIPYEGMVNAVLFFVLVSVIEFDAAEAVQRFAFLKSWFKKAIFR